MLLHKHELYTHGQLKEMGFNTRSPLNVKRYPSSRATNNVNGCTYTTLSLGFPPGTALRPLTLPRYSKLVRNTEAIIWNAPTATKPSLKLEATTQTASQQLVKAIELTKHTPAWAKITVISRRTLTHPAIT